MNPTSSESQTQARALVDRIRREIVDGSLPPGSKLKVRSLVERYEVGASPLREALSRLTASSFVVAQDNRGFRVAGMPPEELERLTWTRIGVECLALRESIARGDLAWEANLVAAHHLLQRTPGPKSGGELPSPQWEEAHHGLHRALVSGCGSPWLLEFIDVLYDRSAIYRRLAARQSRTGPAPRRDVVNEHAAMLDAVIQRDAERACALLTAHYLATQQLVDKLQRPKAKA